MQRPGIIRHVTVHNVEIDGKRAIHAFAVVNWLRLSEQDFGFGSPLSVWYARNFKDANKTEFQDGCFPCPEGPGCNHRLANIDLSSHLSLKP